MLTIVLRNEGFDTAVVGDGTQALTAVRELRPDLVLLDLMLPGMNGIDVCRVPARLGVPIVMLTAKTDTVDVVLAWSPAPTTTSRSRSSPWNWWPASARLRRNDDEPPRCCRSPTSTSTFLRTRSPATANRSPDAAGVRPAGRAGTQTAPGVYSGCAARTGVGYRHPADTRLVNVHVQRLRAKVEKDPENPQVVLTVRGVGYRPDLRDPAVMILRPNDGSRSVGPHRPRGQGSAH